MHFRQTDENIFQIGTLTIILYPYNNREDGVSDSILFIQLTSISIFNVYTLRIGHVDWNIFNPILISTGAIAIWALLGINLVKLIKVISQQ